MLEFDLTVINFRGYLCLNLAGRRNCFAFCGQLEKFEHQQYLAAIQLLGLLELLKQFIEFSSYQTCLYESFMFFSD
jgi:hypothetical protein